MKRSEAEYITGYDSDQCRFRIDEENVLHCWGGPDSMFGYQLGLTGPRTWGTRLIQLTAEEVADFRSADDKRRWIMDRPASK